MLAMLLLHVCFLFLRLDLGTKTTLLRSQKTVKSSHRVDSDICLDADTFHSTFQCEGRLIM